MGLKGTGETGVFVFGAGKIQGADFFQGVSDRFLESTYFIVGDVKTLAMKIAFGVRFDKINFGLNDFVGKRFVQVGKKIVEDKLALVVTG